MRDWSATRVRADALTVTCPDCHAPAGQGCVTKLGPLTAFPAHVRRIRAAHNAAQTPHTATNTTAPVGRDGSTPQNSTQDEI